MAIEYRTSNEKLSEMHRVYILADKAQHPLYKYVVSTFGQYGITRSVLQPGPGEEGKFRTMLDRMKPKILLEIGTANGISALICSFHAEKVITIDINRFPMAETYWFTFRQRDSIDSYVVDDDRDKARLIESLDFDCAFIDGDHSYEGVELDFGLVRECGTVLFHDYWEVTDKGVRDFVNTLPKNEMYFDEPFALWKKKC